MSQSKRQSILRALLPLSIPNLRRIHCWHAGHTWAPEWTDPIRCAHCYTRGYPKEP